MDVSNSDADFDSYWEEEARNPNRNRIRIGRQYQATVTPLLKQGEGDGRQLEELETLRWKPDNELTDQQLDQYLSVAKAVSLFTRAIDSNYSQNSVNSDSHIENDEKNEANSNSNQNTNRDKSETKNDKNKDNISSPTSTSTVKDNRIQSALKGLSEFVSSHHPNHRDIGCRTLLSESTANSTESETPNSLTSLLSSEWNSNEIKLFSRALEVCGKNFSAIKKDFLPWKSVKSIIEQYYLGIGREGSHSGNKYEDNNVVTQSENSENMREESVPNSFAFDILSSVSKFMTSCSDTKSELNDCQRTQSSKMSSDDNKDCDLKKNFEDSKIPSVSGQEVKPLKAKPILPTAIQESNNSVSTVGSLKFFLDGQLVLKLNAQQELTGQKCQWVESSDTAKKVKLMHKSKKRLLNERQDTDVANHSNHKNSNSDELDDGSNESSDDDSLESNESALVPSPSAFIAKKAKVKLENSSHKPLSSPTSLPTKDSKLECNRNLKIECSNSSVKRENLSPNSNHSEEELRRKTSSEQSIERNSTQNCLENKWYHTIVEKSSLLPPKAHSMTSSVPSYRHSRYDSVQNSIGSSSSSTSSPSSSSSSGTGVPVPSVSSNAIPVDLTRKSTNFSPFETKSSSLSSSSTPDFGGYQERDKNSKVFSSPSPPRLQPPFVFPYPAYLPLSPTQSQNKIKREKEVKSSSNLCQKAVEGRLIVKPSPPTSPSMMMPSSTPPLPSQLHSPSQMSSPSQMAWIQNSFASYLPIYEQYYRYYYGYGMPPPNHSPVERLSSSQTPKENETNSKERAKCLTDGVLVDGDDGNCGS